MPVRFSYTAVDDTPTSLMPRLPLTLGYTDRSIDVIGLLDTGSAVNVLPYSVGLALGAVWNDQAVSVQLAGSLGRFEARPLVIWASHPQLTPDAAVRLVFAWIQTEDTPVIFGQVNFFAEFDVCFYRSQGIFEVNLAAQP